MIIMIYYYYGLQCLFGLIWFCHCYNNKMYRLSIYIYNYNIYVILYSSKKRYGKDIQSNISNISSSSSSSN